MPNSSPYDLIRKATQHVTSPDRWAALQHNAQERVPVAQPPAPTPAQSAASPAALSPATADRRTMDAEPSPAHGGLVQPPFAPPQPRHPFLDEIENRHTQAVKTAVHKQAWQPSEPPGSPAP